VELAGALWVDSGPSAACASEIVQTGGISAVIDVMQQVQAPTVHGYGCLLLAGIANSNDRNKKDIYNKGGILRIFNALENFMDHCRVPGQATLSSNALRAFAVSAPTLIVDKISVVIKQ
jgi:hypothetical protein